MMGRFTIKDDTFTEVDGVVGHYVYIFQGKDGDSGRDQITLTPDGAYRLGLELIRRCQPDAEGTMQ